MDDIMLQRYRPAPGGIIDTHREPRPNARLFERDYPATEILETVRWLNERAAGYPTMMYGAHRTA